jgi:hypothetical protein
MKDELVIPPMPHSGVHASSMRNKGFDITSISDLAWINHRASCPVQNPMGGLIVLEEST